MDSAKIAERENNDVVHYDIRYFPLILGRKLLIAFVCRPGRERHFFEHNNDNDYQLQL
ncbi:MAG: hypothetical protein STSR0003_10640 [Smithella sp.]|jgi:hypothetical protein